MLELEKLDQAKLNGKKVNQATCKPCCSTIHQDIIINLKNQI